MAIDFSKIQELLGADAETLLNHASTTIPKENLSVPSSDFIDRVWLDSDRSPNVLRSLQTLFDNGRLARNRLSFDSAGRSGNRTFGRCEFCPESETL